MNNQKEVWLPIKNYKGLYEISNYGRIKSLKRFVKCKGNSERVVGERILISSVDGPYYKQTLAKNNIKKSYNNHRLVAEAFLPNPNNYTTVCHKDDDGLNNHVDNLFWGNQSHNIADMVSKNRQAVGESNGGAKLTEIEVLLIMGKRKKGVSVNDLSNEFNVSDVTIRNIVLGKNWKYLHKKPTT